MSFRINTNVVAMNAFRNLSSTGTEIAKTVTRLSTGMRINDASDDPAGLIASERFRAQIGGIDQALRNNQDALNYAKTAEGALDEVNRLLRDARNLAVAYSGTVDSSQLQANQNQLQNILSSIDRVSSNTQFGTRRLLDGSAGVQANVTNSTVLSGMNIGGRFGSSAITENADVTVERTTAATRAGVTGTRTVAAADQGAYLATATGINGTFAVNGREFSVSSTQTWGDVVNMINNASGDTGVVADVAFGGGNGQINLRSTGYGSNARIELADAGAVILNAAGAAQNAGVNAVASVTIGTQTVTFTGGQNGNDGLTLTDSNGNMLKLTEAGNATGAAAVMGRVVAGSSSFQIGAFAGQTASLSLGNFSSSTLGISSLDVTSANGASAAISAIDNAITNVTRQRGDIGSFMRNTIESNVRALGVARENLSATESAIREIDVAQEMTNYSRLQILQQSGLSVLAQANSAPQSVLGLLR